MGKRLDITGQKFGRLVAIRPVERKNSNLTYWLCKCDCGNEKEVALGSLRRGLTTSCGCIRKDSLSHIAKQRKSYNEYEIVGDVVRVKMVHSQIMICDLDDWERLKDIKWSVGKHGYVIGRDTQNDCIVKFHQQVLGKYDGLVIDHINRNKLDNRKCNLRLVTQTENTWNKSIGKKNTSGVLGVYPHKNKWCASITYNHKKYFLGVYENIEDAEKARKEAEIKFYQIHNRREN